MGRPKKETEETTEVVNKIETKTSKAKVVDENDMTKMMEQMRKQIDDLKKEVKNSQKEKNDMEALVSALKGNTSKSKENNLPKRIKVINLLSNTLYLSTEEDGRGKIFTFENFGDMITINTNTLEDILSVQKYREQAEQMYFYICSREFVDEQDLTEYYETGINKETIEYITSLSEDKCVEMFCSLGETLKDSIATKMAENLLSGQYYDRNRLADIQIRTDFDIEKMSKDFQKVKEHK